MDSFCSKSTFALLSFILLLAPNKAFSQWTDPTLVSRVTPVKAVHITELRTQINTNLALCLLPPQTWTNNTLTPQTTVIKKVDLDELRAATTTLVNAYRFQASLAPSPPVYTDPTITAGVTPIRAAHIGELRAYVSGAVCSPPTNCPAQSLSWNVAGNTCAGNFPVTANAMSATATNVNAGLSGSATFQCTAGAWAGVPNAGATCAPGCLPNGTLSGGGHNFPNNSYNFTTWIGSGMAEQTGLCCSGRGRATSPSCPLMNCAAVDISVICSP